MSEVANVVHSEGCRIPKPREGYRRLPDPRLSAQGVPLTPRHLIAVDPLSIPYGTPVWLDGTEPLSSTPLRRAVRADYFWGWGANAEAQAGRMKQPLRLWVLWPAQ